MGACPVRLSELFQDHPFAHWQHLMGSAAYCLETIPVRSSEVLVSLPDDTFTVQSTTKRKLLFWPLLPTVKADRMIRRGIGYRRISPTDSVVHAPFRSHGTFSLIHYVDIYSGSISCIFVSVMIRSYQNNRAERDLGNLVVQFPA